MTPLVVLALAWTLGILLAQAFPLSAVWLLVLPPVPVLLGGWGKRRWARRVSLALVGLMLGALRMTLVQPHITPDHIASYMRGDPVEVMGVITSEPDPRSGDTRLRVEASHLLLPDGEAREVQGRILVYAPPYADVRYGDRIRVLGTLTLPPVFEDFSYRDYLARQDIHVMMPDARVEVTDSHQANPVREWLIALKRRAHQSILRMIPEPEASLLSGILLGIERGIDPSLLRAFEVTGTSHIIAISGFNLTVIAAIFARLSRRLVPRGWETPVAMAGLWLYVVLVGASAAVLRAGVMASIAVLAQRDRRPIHGPTSIAAAVLALSIANPYIYWDVGFQLSLTATLGLVMHAPLLSAWTEQALSRVMARKRAERWAVALTDPLLVTVAAQITTLGITASVFHQVSLVTLLTNLLILPVQTLIMLVGGVAALLGALWLPLGRAPAWIAWGFLRYTTAAVRWTAGFPGAAVTLERVTPVMVWGYYGGLAAVTAWAINPTFSLRGTGVDLWRRLRSLPTGAAAVGVVTVVLAGVGAASVPDGRLHVAVLDVGLGDAVYIRTPGGRQVLIDGGSDASRTMAALGAQMPFWDRSLDFVVLTSPDPARLAGLIPVLSHLEVAMVGYSPEEAEGPYYDEWSALVAARQLGTSGLLTAGQRWMLDETVVLDVLWPPAGEVGPLVLRLGYGDVCWLLPGDATTMVEQALVEGYDQQLGADVLLLPRHGDPTAASPAFLQVVDPSVVVISTGDAHPPSPYVVARLLDRQLFRTDRNGTIRMRSDGNNLRIRTSPTH